MFQNDQHILTLLGDELGRIHSNHNVALADLTQKMEAENDQKLAQKQLEIDELHKTIDASAGDQLALTRLKDEHTAQIQEINKEFNGVKVLFSNLFERRDMHDGESFSLIFF